MLVAFPNTPSHCSTVADRPQDAVESQTNILRSTTKPLQSSCSVAENLSMDTLSAEADPIGPEHFLAALYGIFTLLLGATVWSAMAAVFGVWSLPAVPGLGWMIAWACRYGGRCADTVVRATAWLLALAGVLLALFVFSAFSVTQSSPDSGFLLHAVGPEYLRLFAEPPWFGSAAVLLALAGAWRALRERPARRATARPVLELARAAADARPGASLDAGEESGARAA